LAHLIRDVRFLTTLPDVRVQTYGTRLREALRALFGVIHRREQLTAERFQSQLEAARAEVLRCATSNVPASNHCRNLAKRFETHGESYCHLLGGSKPSPLGDGFSVPGHWARKDRGAWSYDLGAWSSWLSFER
jgi:hypothetical protein